MSDYKENTEKKSWKKLLSWWGWGWKKIIAAIFIVITALILLIVGCSMTEKDNVTSHINCKIAEIGVLRVKGQIVSYEERSWGMEKAVFVYDVDATLSVNMSDSQKNGSELSLPAPRVIIAGVNHRSKENKYRRSRPETLRKMEKSASTKAQEKIKEIANSDEMKTLAKQQAALVIPAIFYPGEKIDLKWRD